jgi:prophage tail gpP-like protein
MIGNRELVTVVAGGQAFGGWKDVEIVYGLNRAARSFTLKVTEAVSDTWAFAPGTAVEIHAAPFTAKPPAGFGDLLATGYVDDYAPSHDAERHEVTITSRSKAGDYVDSAAEVVGGLFENKTPEEIARELDKFGVGIGAKVPGDKIPYYQITQGDTAFRAAERACRQQGICLMGLADGSIELTDASKAGRQPGTLRLGSNILRGSGHISHAKRFSDHKVKGQARSGHGDTSLRIEETAQDPAVKRYRPRVVIAETATDQASAARRAQIEAQRMAGFSTRATVTVQSFRDETGALWQANNLVFVDDRKLRIKGDMLIETVRLTQNDGAGTLALLSLVDPRAYNGKKPQQSKSDDVWTEMPE